MHVFKDKKGGRVELTFATNQYEMPARHVLLVLKYKAQWLLTKHRTRGIEFPGGKAEKYESIEDAVIRETYEETGVHITNVIQFAEYVVHSEESFCKAVFTGDVVSIDAEPALYETEGAIWLSDDALNRCENLSFHMIDTGMELLREWVDRHVAQRNDCK